MVEIFKFITSKRGTLYKKVQEPFIKSITVYIKNGYVTDIGITAKVERMKKARYVGLCEERKIVHVEDDVKIINPDGFDIQTGSFMLIYYLDKRELKIFRNN